MQTSVSSAVFFVVYHTQALEPLENWDGSPPLPSHHILHPELPRGSKSAESSSTGVWCEAAAADKRVDAYMSQKQLL